MSGKKVYSVEHTTVNSAAKDNNRDMFAALFNFFERNVTVGNAQRIALYYGSGASGTGFTGDTNPFGENAFAVYKYLATASTKRTFDFYVMITWADQNALQGVNFGSPDGIGIAMAVCEDGTSSPWNGTTNNDGTDTKGTPIWDNATSPAHVIHRAASAPVGGTAGSYVTNKNAMMFVADAYLINAKLFVVGDADYIYTEYERDGDNLLDNQTYCGIFESTQDYTGTQNLVAFANTVSDFSNQKFELTTTSSSSSGGIYVNNEIYGVATETINMTVPVTNDITNKHDSSTIWVSVSDPSSTKHGVVGSLPEELSQTTGLSPRDLSNDLMRTVVSNNNSGASKKLIVPWDGGTGVGSNSTPQGILSDQDNPAPQA